MENNVTKNPEDLSQGSESLNSNNTSGTEKKLSAADLLLQRISEKKTGSFEEMQVPETHEHEETPVDLISGEKLTVVDEVITESEEVENFMEFGRPELTEKLKEFVENLNIAETKDKIEAIKTAFYKKLKFEISELKKQFVEQGGNEEEFTREEDESEIKFKELLAIYKTQKADWTEKNEAVKASNLAEKYKIIEEIKNLINSPESFNNTFNTFKDLQKHWREIGPVPQAEAKTLWDSYNVQVENFYNYVNINKELRDLDYKKNLEVKIALCEKAEMLTLQESVVKAFKLLQELHNQWRDAGPVPNEKKDEVWERFRTATVTINKRHQEHFESLKAEQEKNYLAKQTLCEKAEEIAETTPSSHKEWKEKSDKIVELQQLWKGVGYAPKKHNQEIYERFRTACDKFFAAKRDFFAEDNEEKNNNLQLKTDLCVQAETLRESTDWKKTTETLKNLQEEWKKIGPVPAKQSDAVWHRFRKACNAFFDRKEEFFKNRSGEESENLTKKNDIIEKIKNFEFTDFNTEDMTRLRDLQNEWTQIGFVPFEMKDKIYKEYRKALDEQIEKLNIDRKERKDHKFRERVNGMKNSSNANELVGSEVDKLRQKIEKINNDIKLWENNIGFFANTKNAEVMIKDIKQKIEKSREYVAELKGQIKVLMENEAQ